MSELGRAHFERRTCSWMWLSQKDAVHPPTERSCRKPLSEKPSLLISTAGFLSLTFKTCSIQ